MTEAVDHYGMEANRIRRAALIAAERHYAVETPRYSSIIWFGIPSAVLSAIAGAAAFSKITHSELVAGSISITVAILSSLMTFLDPAGTAANHHAAAKDYESLYHEAGYCRRVELQENDLDMKKGAERLRALSDKLINLDRACPALSGRVYETAAHNLKVGRGEVVRDPYDLEEINFGPSQKS